MFRFSLGRVKPVQESHYILRSHSIYPVFFLVVGFEMSC